jgi:diphthine synthase
MLFFVGLGLYDQRDISVRGLEAVKCSDLVYAEFYTSSLMGVSNQELEEFYGRKIEVLSRDQVEVSPEWIEEAREKDVAFLVGGDPMASTTHLDLRLRALDLGIKTEVIHSSSIVTAAPGLSGLQNYRFGRSTTIPFPYQVRGKRIVPETPYVVVKENLERNLHTLIFLDIQADQEKRYMTVNQASELLLEMERNAGGNVLKDAIGVGIARAGSPGAVIKADRLDCLKDHDFGGPLHILIVPAKLHFMEAKALVALAGAPPEIARESEH